MFFLIWFNITEYLWHKWPRRCSVCRNHNPVPSSFMTYHFRNKSNTTGATCGARTEYPSGARKSPTPYFRHFRHHWKEIEKNETLAKLLPAPPVVAFRWPKNIKDTLVRAAVSRPSSTVGQCKPCGDKSCKCCLQLQSAQVFHSKTTRKEYKIFCNVNCKTPNVVYLLDCHVSGSQYVGESVQLFNKWMNGHRSDLTKKTHLPVSQHFLSPGHSLDDFGRSKIYIIDHNPSWKENQRQKREGFWIRELRTLHPEA